MDCTYVLTLEQVLLKDTVCLSQDRQSRQSPRKYKHFVFFGTSTWRAHSDKAQESAETEGRQRVRNSPRAPEKFV